VSAAYLRIEVQEGALLRAVAEEASIVDADLDELEDRLLHGGLDPEKIASLALTVARAGRSKSTWALKSARSKLVAASRKLEVQVLDLALDLVQTPPPARLSRAESGYRWGEGSDDDAVFVEDPLAAYWHRRDRWGPPHRPDPTRAPLVASAPGPIEPWLAEIDDGGTVMVCFAPEWPWSRPEPPLRLTRAGLSRDVALTMRIRWSQVGSIGTVTRGVQKRAAFEVHGEPRETLPGRPMIGTPALVALMSKLVERSRS